jgi:hypothetical protein
MSAVIWWRRRPKDYDVEAQFDRARAALVMVERAADRLAELAKIRAAAEGRQQDALERLRESACDD